MTEQECLARMVAPGQVRPSKPYRGGVIQIHITRACDKACNNCTQGSELAGKVEFMSPAHFEQAVLSLKGYFGVYGVFGGNPALSPHFGEYCEILRKHVPFEQRGLWCNHPRKWGKEMRATFNPAVSNLNVHLDREAYEAFLRDWPEAHPVGLYQDSRHAPVHLAMKDVIADEGKRWELISTCDINQRWSAMIGVFRGELRAWFCEVAGAQAILHQYEPDYPDTGLDPMMVCSPENPNAHLPTFLRTERGMDVYPLNSITAHMLLWWELPMRSFAHQVRKHCHECAVPLRGYGELAMATDGVEQTSATHASIFKPKRPGRKFEIVTSLEQLGLGRIAHSTDYLGNAAR